MNALAQRSLTVLGDHLARDRSFGLGRYSWSVVDVATSAFQRVQPTAAWRQGTNHSFAWRTQPDEYPRRPTVNLLPLGRRTHAFMWQLRMGHPVERYVPGDMLHVTEPGYRIKSGLPRITSVHDVGPLLHPEFFESGRPRLFASSMRQARHESRVVLFSSRATRDAFLATVGAPACTHRVIYPGVARVEELQSNRCDQPTLPGLSSSVDRAMLVVGSINPRKNLHRVLAAHQSLPSNARPLLWLVGEFGWGSLTANSLPSDVHFLGYVSEVELQWLYQHARALIFASVYEGFGYPPVEAMAAGCPVIASRNGGSIGEVVGTAAEVVDELSVESIARGMRRVHASTGLRSELSERGKRRSRLFGMDQFRDALLDAYRMAAGEYA